MKWVITQHKLTGLLLVIFLLVITGCKTHSPNSFTNFENFQQQLIIRDAYVPIDNSKNKAKTDSLNFESNLSDSYIISSDKDRNELIKTVNWEHRQSSVDQHRIYLEINHVADSISHQFLACGQTWKEVIQCSEMAYFEITAIKGERAVTYRDSINLKLLNELFLLERSDN